MIYGGSQKQLQIQGFISPFSALNKTTMLQFVTNSLLWNKVFGLDIILVIQT